MLHFLCGGAGAQEEDTQGRKALRKLAKESEHGEKTSGGIEGKVSDENSRKQGERQQLGAYNSNMRWRRVWAAVQCAAEPLARSACACCGGDMRYLEGPENGTRVAAWMQGWSA